MDVRRRVEKDVYPPAAASECEAGWDGERNRNVKESESDDAPKEGRVGLQYEEKTHMSNVTQ